MKSSLLTCSLIFAVVVGWVAYANPIEAGSINQPTTDSPIPDRGHED